MASKQATSMVVKESYAVTEFDPADLEAYLRDATGGGKLSTNDLDVIKVPTGGATFWTIPDLEQGERPERLIEGIVVYQRPNFAWWNASMSSGSGNAPDCTSQDGQYGVGAPLGHPDLIQINTPANGGFAYETFDADGNQVSGPAPAQRFDCSACPHAQFGTKRRDDGSMGRGKDCRQGKLLFMLRPDSILPFVVSVPPSSDKLIRNFFLRFIGQRPPRRPSQIVISLGLEKTKNQDSVDYSEIKPSWVRDLDADESARIGQAVKMLLPLFATVTVDPD